MEIGVNAGMANAVPPLMVIEELPKISDWPIIPTNEFAVSVAITEPAVVFAVTLKIVPT
jgi:hypothetical protein